MDDSKFPDKILTISPAVARKCTSLRKPLILLEIFCWTRPNGCWFAPDSRYH